MKDKKTKKTHQRKHLAQHLHEDMEDQEIFLEISELVCEHASSFI